MGTSNPTLAQMASVNGDSLEADLMSRMQSFRKSDEDRTRLVEQVLSEYFRLQSLYEEKCNDYENEVTSRRHWQNEAMSAKREGQQIRQRTEHSPFALALIDGDGVLFQEALLRAGAEGGSEAAHHLLKELKRHIQERHEDSGAGQWSIMVQIYANFDGLSRKLASIGMIKSTNEFNAFARAFSLSQPLFSFIDVGSGKERADHKLRETYRLFVSNVQCKHIIFGGCHDNGYLPTLEPFRRDESVSSRMTLLESTPAQRDYHLLGFPIIKFPTVFSSEPLPDRLFPQATPSYAPNAQTTMTMSPPISSLPAVSATQEPPRSLPPAAPATVMPAAAISPAATPAAAASTYASVGGGDATKEISIRPSKPPAQRRAVYLNAHDQRIDPKLPPRDVQAAQRLNSRIKDRKVCNNYHLNGSCANGNACPYNHGERLNQKEQLALRHKARERACEYGSECRSVDCFFGHQCPREGCNWDNCYFEDLHDLDTVIKMKQYEDGSIEIVH